jgi:hypothetical protein
VTANANSTSDQQLMELSVGAGYFNSLGQPFLFNAAGVYSTQTLQTPTLTLKVKLCTVSGCGSGTVITLVSIVSTAAIASTTNQNWNMSFLGYTATTGTSGNLEIHGPLVVDLGATTATADSVFGDTNTAASSTINLTGALFVDFTIAFSTQPTTPFNTITQRSGGVMPFAATAAPVTSVFGLTGAVVAPVALGASTATTQSACDNSTKVATTAYVGLACSQVQTSGSPFTLTAQGQTQWNNTTGAYVWDLPVPTGSGPPICIGQYRARTGVISLVPSSGVNIVYKGVVGTAGSSTGLVSGGAAGDFICVQGVDSTTWEAIGAGIGTWTNN